ncbi:MAG TPA: hypothetical protein VIH42_10240 [Thermoguttaceae bacterium]
MISYRIELRLPFPPGFTKTQFADIKREALKIVAEKWHAILLQKHFKPSARREYEYQPRKEKYQKTKIRAVVRGKAEAAFDLIFSGLTKRMAMQRPQIRAFPTRARIDLAVPFYIEMRSKMGKPPMGDEMTRVTYQESQQLSQMLVKEIERIINEKKRAREVREFYSYFRSD